jgi:oligopeptide/dipeptide ABC transporter ATP-binding protein
MTEPLLVARDLVKTFSAGGGWFGASETVQALSGVSLDLAPGETLAIVGESGCGKSALARCLIGLTDLTDGELTVGGEDSRVFIKRDALAFHRFIQIVFQDPYASLNPRRTIQQSIADALRLHRMCKQNEERARVADLLSRVGLSADYLERYPHELSGGQRQRACIARALAVEPKVLVCDEPVSALDVSIQAQIINLLKDIQRRSGLAYIFISHNINLVRHISDRIAVMYLGQIVELGTTEALRNNLLHPYSRALFAATPVIGRSVDERAPNLLTGDVPSPLHPPSGCRFRTRCSFATNRCAAELPSLRQVAGRMVRCHYAEEIDVASSQLSGR